MITATELIGSGHELDTRAADTERDRVDDVLPQLVVEPRTPEAVAATLQWASVHRLSTVIRGQGSKTAWGARPGPIDVVLDLSRLNRILDYQAGDLTVTVEAGTRLSDANHHLASHAQWLALDPPFGERATIGGLLATNDSGPQRHRFGTPRDLVIGIQLATTDGSLSKAGGRVVKNVAGYDLTKIVSGSFGTLAAIVSATFKLSPLPGTSATVVADRLGIEGLASLCDTMAESQLEPVAFDVAVQHPAGVEAPDVACLIRFASFPGVVEAEVANVSARIARSHQAVRTVTGDSERALWTTHGRRPWDDRGTIVRVAWRPADVKQALTALARIAGTCGFELAGRLGVGAGYVRLDGDMTNQQEAVTALRRSGVFGNVVVAAAPLDLKTPDFVWGPGRDTSLAGALKRELDPAGILGAGRGPV